LKGWHKRLLDGKSSNIMINEWFWREPFLYYEIQDAGMMKEGTSAVPPFRPLH
jgi:hypothetical protein